LFVLGLRAGNILVSVFPLLGGLNSFLFALLILFVSRFFCLLISRLLSSWPVCAASCVLLWFVRSLPRSVGLVPTSSVSDGQRLRLLWQYCQTAVSLVFGWIMSPTREARLIAYPPLGCSLRMRREQPVLDRHRPVSILCGDLWPSLQGWLTLLPVSHPVSTGGSPGERVGSVVWACTPDPVDLSSPRWSPPLQRSAASALPEGSHMPLAEEKSHWKFFGPVLIYIYIILLYGLFSYDGYYSETDRTGTVHKTIHLLKCEASMQRPPPHSHDVNPHLIATCLYKSALLVAELDSCLHPKRASDVGPYPGKCLRPSPFFPAL